MRHSHERELLRLRNENASTGEKQECRYGWEEKQSRQKLADIFKSAIAARSEPFEAGAASVGSVALPDVDAGLAIHVLPVAERGPYLEDVASVSGLELDAKEC